MTDIGCITTLLGASTLVLAGGVVHGLRTGLDGVSTATLAGFTLFSGLMAAGAIGQL
jgi:hypothetical protein